MSLAMPALDARALGEDGDRLERAVGLVHAAQQVLDRAGGSDLASAELTAGRTAALQARQQDLADLAEVLTHARNVLGTLSHGVVEAAGRRDRAWTDRGRDRWVRRLVEVVALGCEQLASMSAVTVAEVPHDAPTPGRPLDAAHARTGGVVRVSR